MSWKTLESAPEEVAVLLHIQGDTNPIIAYKRSKVPKVWIELSEYIECVGDCYTEREVYIGSSQAYWQPLPQLPEYTY